MSFSNLKGLLIGLALLAGIIPAGASPVKVVAISEDFASIARSIGQEKVDVVSLISGSRNLHDITAKPSMVLKLRNADLLIRLGMKQDSWIDGLIQTARNSQLYPGQTGYLDASGPISKLEVPSGAIDGSMGDIHKYGNPHYWLDPQNGIVIAEQIRDRLSSLDPENKAFYFKNHTAFAEALSEKIAVWKKRMATLQGRPFIAYHKTWSYFFDGFGLTSGGFLEPLPGIPPTIKHLAHLKRSFTAKDNPIVITATYFPSKMGTVLAKEMDAPFFLLPTNVDNKGINSYTDLFDVLVNELTNK